MQHQPRSPRNNHGLCTSPRWHRCWPTTGNIRQGTCASGKLHTPMASDIGHTTLVVDYHVRKGLLLSLSWRRAWIIRIGLGMCTSLSDHRACPSHITLHAHNGNLTLDIGCRHIYILHIAQPMTVLECLLRLLLVHISNPELENVSHHYIILVSTGKVIPGNDMQHQPRPIRMSCAMCASVGWYQYRATIGNFF